MSSNNTKSKKGVTVNQNVAKKSFQHDTGTMNMDAKNLVDKARKYIRDSNKSKQNEHYIQEAFKNLSEACNKDGQMSSAFSHRGICYNQMGDFQRALYDFSVAIRIANEKKEDHKTLADYYSK